MHTVSNNIMGALEQQLIQIIQCNLLPGGPYRTGGTAVYFYFHHRISVDLDFFTPDKFSSELFLHSTRQCFDQVRVELLREDTVIFYLGRKKVKFSLFRFPYKPLSRAYEMPMQEGVACPLAPLDDIMAMKAVAISQRGSMKDFIDLFFVLRKTNMHFNRMAKLVTDKYDLNQSYDYQLKTSLVYFDDAEGELDQIVMLKNNVAVKMTVHDWETMKAFYRDFIE